MDFYHVIYKFTYIKTGVNKTQNNLFTTNLDNFFCIITFLVWIYIVKLVKPFNQKHL